MATIIFVVIFLLFRNIFADNPECEKESFCECSENVMNSHALYISNKGVKFGINVKSWTNSQIKCEDISWKDLNLSREPKRDEVDSLNFENCPLPEENSLKNITIKLGLIEKNKLSFQSHKNLSESLKKEHLEGFSNVTTLILSQNGFSEIPSDLLTDFHNLVFLDLSENNFDINEKIFSENWILKKLDLHGNEITKLAPRLFDNLEYLEVLNLKRNLLENLNEEIFDKLLLLKYLNLESNLLSDLPEFIFDNLEKLEIIDLSNNNFSSLPSRLFARNKQLQKVLLNNNNNEILTTLPDKFLTELDCLEEVQLKNDGLYSLPENLFWGSKSLKYIDLSENLLESLPEFIFLELSNIEYLSISYNRITTLPDAIFSYLENLQILDLSFNNISYIQRNLLEDLTSLTELNMETNRIRIIENAAFLNNKHLTIAKFNNNLLRLSYSNELKSPFFHNRLLKELYLAKNGIQNLFIDWTISKPYLKLLDLTGNEISTLSANNLVFSSDDILVDLRYNNISNIFLNNIESLAMHHTEERDVVVHVEHNPILCDCNLYYYLLYLNKTMPTIVYNLVDIVIGDSTCVQLDGKEGPKINQLDFKTYRCPEHDYFKSNENCQNNCTCYVRPYDGTRIVDCSYKNMSVFQIDKNNIHLFKRYPLIVNLTGNYLKEIPYLKDLKPINVTELLLSNNQISEISLDRLPSKLKLLELHNNNISQLDVRVINRFILNFYQKITLSGNPFICNCNARYLLRLALTKRYFSQDLENVKCRGSNIPIVNMKLDQFC